MQFFDDLQSTLTDFTSLGNAEIVLVSKKYFFREKDVTLRQNI